MPNGKPGDAPWSDFFLHGHDVFPPDIAAMLRAIYGVDPRLIRHLAHPDMWRWEEGHDLEDGRAKLKKIINDNSIPLP